MRGATGSVTRGAIAGSSSVALTPADDDGTTRLLQWVMLEPARFIMERGMLPGIRSRPAGLAVELTAQPLWTWRKQQPGARSTPTPG